MTQQPAGQEKQEGSLAAKEAAVAATQQSTKQKGGKEATEVAAVMTGWRMASVGGQERVATIKQPFLYNEHNFI